MISPIWNTAGIINKFREVIASKPKTYKCKQCNEPKPHLTEHGLCDDCTEKAWDKLLADLKLEPTYHNPKWSWEA